MYLNLLIFFLNIPESTDYIEKLQIHSEQQNNLDKEIFGENYDEKSAVDIENHLKEHPEDLKTLMDNLFVSMKDIKPLILAVLGLFISLILIFTIPIYKIIRHISYYHYCSKNKYIRSNTGKILVEQIAAMQRYIHEFSLLSEKEKEQVQLWDDYLVYAVLLEENEKIINDVFKYKNIEKNLFI